ARVEAVVSAAGIDTLRQDLEVGADGVARGVIADIPVGVERRIDLSVYSAAGRRTHAGYAGGLTVAAAETLQVSIALVPLAGALGVAGTVLADNDPVPYRVTFEATWSAATHPEDFPSRPHFSGPIGVVHNGNVTFWQEGALASDGIKDMAELGRQVTLGDEFAVARANGHAGPQMAAGQIDPSPGSLSLDFEAEPRFPLVTLVSMVAPSPDWFVGVSGLSLVDAGGAWLDSVRVPLYALDAGTDSGPGYSSPNQVSDPRQPISRLGSGSFLVSGQVPPLGTFTFVRR
ncbi:MAG: spondin domain-containing protein, partial [Gemmatimonadota bacterium]